MKLFFLKQDSLYKIFTTLEKIPKKSHVEIFIETENQFFNNSWRSKQIDGILQKKEIKAIFIAETNKQRDFFEHNSINYDMKKQNKLREVLNIIYRFFFNIRKFHLYSYQKKNYTFFAIFGSEVFLMIMLGYFFYSLILPKTTITIAPSYQINEIVYNFRYMKPEDIVAYPYKDKHIIIPLYKAAVKDASLSLSIDKADTPAQSTLLKGKVRLINTTTAAIGLQKNTQLINDDGIEFTTVEKSIIPKSEGENQAGSIYVNIIAKDNAENNALIKTHGQNITLGNRLLIKKLKQSLYTKQVYGEISEGFTTKIVKNTNFVLFNEIGALQKSLYSELFDKRKQYVTPKDVPEGGIFIPFNQFISLDDCKYSASGDNKNLSELKTLAGSLHCTINFSYIKKEDIIKGIEAYITKRSTDSKKVVNIQNNLISFYQVISGEYNAFIIPTRVNVIESYNIQTDRNNIIGTLKSQIMGTDIINAKNIIGTYPEIETADIKISPRRYSTITNTKSRIFFKIKDINTE